MAILSRVKISPQQRYDLEDLFAAQASERADSKLWTQKFLSEDNLILSGFSVTGVGLNFATVAMTGCAFIMPQNSFDFSYFVSAPVEPDVTIPDADLVDGSRNYLEVELATQDGTPLTKAFWDPEANSGDGAEFNQIVNTITDLKVQFVVSTAGFSGSPDRLPIAIIDVNGSGTIKQIFDRRELFGRLSKPNDLDNEYAWGVKVEPVYSLNMTGAVGVFVAGETISIGGETATVVSGGTASITFNEPTGINFFNGDSVTGLTSGATGTINTTSESFVGVDKNLKGQKDINDALMTEIKLMKGTRFWWQSGSSLSGLKTEIASLIAPVTGGARVKWDGSNLILTDDNLSPSDTDQVAAVRLLASTANLMLTRQDDGKEVVTITFPEVADAGTIILDQNGNLISIDWDFNTAAIQAAWNGSGADAATISGSVAAKKIVITFDTTGVKADVTENTNTLENAGNPVPSTITIKQGMPADGSIPIGDGQFLFIQLPNPLADAVYDGVGVGALNFQVADRGNLSINDQSYWLAYREGTKLVWRFAGELQPGEESQISDNVPQGILDAIGIVSETSMPSYSSDIRGYPQESLTARAGVLTDAVGDEQEDRSGYLRSDDVVTWTGTQLEFTTDIVLEFINTKDGSVRQHVVSAAESPIVVGDQEDIYVLIDREASSPQAVTTINSGTTPIPAQSQAQKDVFVLFRRNDALGNPFLHIPFHKQVLEAGQSVNLGASGSGSGSGDSLAGDYKRRLVLSPFQFVTPNVFETTKATLVDLASTGEFSPAKKAFKIDSGETFVSVQMLDPDFLDDGVDVSEIELWLDWLSGFVDTAATYEVSRDGGNNWQDISSVMTRIGLSNSYRGYWTFATEGSNQDLQGYAVGNADTTDPLNATTGQSRAQGFTVTSQEVVKQVEVYLNKTGSPSGTYKVKIVRDSAGAPSTSAADILSESDLQNVSSLSAGNNTVLITVPAVVLPAASYWLVFETDATYKSSFSAGVTQIAVRADGSAPTTSDSQQFNGTAWSTVAGNALTYQFKGRLHDLRVRITSSANDKYIQGYGLFYGIYNGVTTSGEKRVQKFTFSGDLNSTSFTLNWAPDPDLLRIFDPYKGQVYVVDGSIIKVNGAVVTFENNFFNDPGETILLIFMENDGTSFDNSDQNANAISAIQSQLIDIGDELASISDSMVLPKVVVPNTTIQNRAQIVDLTQDLKERFGRDRIMTQDLVEMQSEMGPSGEQVFSVVNDLHGQMRFAGSWTPTNDATGQYVIAGGSGNDFFEVTGNCSGLNLICELNGSARDVRYKVDGGAESANFLPNSGVTAAVLDNRNYSSLTVVKVAWALTPGVHTFKIRSAGSNGIRVYGIEFVYENTSGLLTVPQGSQIYKGKRRTHSVQETSAYNTTFESGTLGSRGGRVLRYQKSDGSVAKSVTPTDASALFMTSANHGNETLLDTVWWRELGAGRADDFSTLVGSTSDRAFTLDDYLTTLVGSSVFASLTDYYTSTTNASTGIFHLFTFYGTGLDILRQDSANGTINQHEVFVDGVSVGNMATTASTSKRVETIASGLPCGTHCVRIQRQVSGGTNMGIHAFKVYGPKKPTLPADAVETGEYFINATYVANATAAVDRIGTGVVRSHGYRRWTYVGAGWTSTAVGVGEIGGSAPATGTASDYAETVIFGTGFDVRTSGGANNTYTVSVDGSTNLSGFATSAYGFGSGSFVAATGTMTITGGTDNAGVSVSNLSMGPHTIRITKTAGASGLRPVAIDEVTPIYVPRSLGNYTVQNTRKAGNQCILDLRKFSKKDVSTPTLRAQAVNVGAGESITSTSYVPVRDMSVTVEVKTAGMLKISFSIVGAGPAANNVHIQAALNEIPIGSYVGTFNTSVNQTWTGVVSTFVQPGIHKIDLYGSVNGGTAQLEGSKLLLVEKD